ncbi:hypothetical protein CR513_18485, partial [Mucuna pruriens]
MEPQRTGYILHEYWERFNKLCATCPHHQINEQLLIQYFYEGLSMMDRSMIDAASGGALMDKTPVAARHLISNMASNTQQFGIRLSNPSQPENEIGAASNQRLENQLTELTSLVRQLAVSQHHPAMAAKIYGICTLVEHPTDLCPTLQETDVGAVGGFQYRKQPYQNRQFDNQPYPKYAKFLKELCIHKRRKMKGNRELGGVVSSLTKNNHTTGISYVLLKKCRDPGIFSVSCTIGNCTFADAMLDLGASINVMPASTYRSLNFKDLEPTGMTIHLANRSIVQPLGVLEDVLVEVNELIFPADCYVLDMEDETSGKGSTLILGRPFLMTARTKIDVHAGTLSMEFSDTLV